MSTIFSVLETIFAFCLFAGMFWFATALSLAPSGRKDRHTTIGIIVSQVVFMAFILFISQVSFIHATSIATGYVYAVIQQLLKSTKVVMLDHENKTTQ